jgi:NTE family protein
LADTNLIVLTWAFDKFIMNKIVPIFSGGGTRLSAHIGILNAIKDLNIDFDHIVGVSGGSIVCSLYCAGMSIKDISNLAEETDFRKFKGFSLLRLFTQGGLSSGNTFEAWMDHHLNGKTFAQIDKNLSILATDVNGGGPVIFNKENCPDMKISLAVRYSMSIPLLFSFKSYRHHILVDGAILSEDALHQDWAKDGTDVICFRLKSEQLEIQEFKKSWVPIAQYLNMLIRTFMTALSREYVHEQFWQNTIVVNTENFSSVDFNLSVQQKQSLYKMGYDTAFEFLPQRLVKLNHYLDR